MRDVFLICRAKLLGGFRRGRLRMALYALLAIVVLACTSLMEGLLLYAMIHSGIERFFPLVLLAPSVLFSLFSSAYMASGQLVSAGDHDIVVSLPVSRMAVALSRLLGVYSINMLSQLAILLPGGVLWAVMMRPDWPFYAVYPLMMLSAQLIPLTLGSLLGLAIARIGSWFKSTRVVTLLLSIAGLLLYLNVMLTLDLENLDWLHIGDELQRWVFRLYPPVRLFQAGMLGESPAQGLLFVALDVAAIAVFAVFYSRYYLRIHALMVARRAGRRFHMTRQKRDGVMRSLLVREVRRYFASNTYVLNTGFGLILSVVMLIYMKIQTPEALFVLLGMPFLNGVIELALPLLVAFLLGTVCTTGVSLSLEGKNLWILRSMPVNARQIVAVKVLFNLALAAPFLVIDGILMLSTFRTTPLGTVLLFATPLLVLVFTALLGMLINLKFYRLDWQNEADIVKRSVGAGLPVLISVLLTMGAGALAGVLVFQGRNGFWVGWAYPLLMLVLDALLAALLYVKAEPMMARIRM